MDYEVIWNGTRASACGSPYLAAEQFTPAPGADQPKPIAHGISACVLDWLESLGPATVRELADGIGLNTFQINSAILTLKKRGLVVVVDQRRVTVRQFGARLVAVYGVPA